MLRKIYSVMRKDLETFTPSAYDLFSIFVFIVVLFCVISTVASIIGLIVLFSSNPNYGAIISTWVATVILWLVHWVNFSALRVIKDE